jgi:beta-fructofuranosidase
MRKDSGRLLRRHGVFNALGLTGTGLLPGAALAGCRRGPEPEALQIRRRMAADHLRPLYHFLPPHNWMNDPNGVIQWQGRYHLFYQHNPNGPYWADMHWGHAVSDDLVHWRDWPIALAPTPGGPDQNGCWSGSAVVDDGTPTVVYTGVSFKLPEEGFRGGPDAMQTVCLARSQDGMRTWEKDPRNPVLSQPPADLDISPEGFRDPYVWRQDDHWEMVIATGILGQGGAVLLYRSPDLRDWQVVGPLYLSREHGPFFECPSFFPLADRHVLIFGQMSVGRSRYVVGTYADQQFTAEGTGLLDAGPAYAPQILIDQRGRRLLFTWIWEGGWPNSPSHADWAGICPLPRLLSLRSDGTVVSRPIPELTALRGTGVHLADIDLSAGEERALPVRGNCLELVAELDVSQATGGGLRLCCSGDGREKTTVVYDRLQRSLTLSAMPASRDWPQRSSTVTDLSLAAAERLKLHIFIDRSIVEVFANDRCSLTSRVYPKPDSQGIRLFANGGPVSLTSLDAWHMNPIWPTG